MPASAEPETSPKCSLYRIFMFFYMLIPSESTYAQNENSLYSTLPVGTAALLKPIKSLRLPKNGILLLLSYSKYAIVKLLPFITTALLRIFLDGA